MTLNEFFSSLNNGARWDVGVSINRSNALPLDANSVFASLEAAQAYVNGTAEGVLANAYPGQVLAVVTENETVIYYVDAKMALQPVGNTKDVMAYIGAIPEGSDAKTIIEYINKKTEGIATDTALAELQSAVEALEAINNATQAELDAYKTEVETAINEALAEAKKYADDNDADTIYDDTALTARVEAIEKDYLKEKDKYDDTALAARVKKIEDDYLTEEDKYDDTALATRIKAIEDDYLTEEDKYDDTALKERVKNIEDNYAKTSELVDYTVSVSTENVEDTNFKHYVFTQCGEQIAHIDIPKDLVVSSGEVIVATEADKAFDDKVVEGETYIKLIVANQAKPLYIAAKDLVDIYTAKANAIQVQVAISDNNEISATIVAGSIGTTELDEEVNGLLGLAETAVQEVKLVQDTVNEDGNTYHLSVDGAILTKTYTPLAGADFVRGVVGKESEAIKEYVDAREISVMPDTTLEDGTKSTRVTLLKGEEVLARDLATVDYVSTELGKAIDASEEKTAEEFAKIPGLIEESVEEAKDYTDEEFAKVPGLIEGAIAELDVEDTAVAGKYVSAVKQVDGKIEVTRADLPTLPEISIKEEKGDAANISFVGQLTADGHEITTKSYSVDSTNSDISVGTGTSGEGLIFNIKEKAVDTENIANGAVTAEKLGADVQAYVEGIVTPMLPEIPGITVAEEKIHAVSDMTSLPILAAIEAENHTLTPTALTIVNGEEIILHTSAEGEYYFGIAAESISIDKLDETVTGPIALAKSAVQGIKDADGNVWDKNVLDGTVIAPWANDTVAGIIKTSNEIGLTETHQLEIKEVNVNKLTQTKGEWLILNGGDAALTWPEDEAKG